MTNSSPFDFDLHVVIATHQRRDLLVNALNSILVACHKTNKKYLISLVFNGENKLFSLDLLSASFSNEQIKFEITYSNETLKPARARNSAIQKHEVSWLAFLDDDIIVPEDYFHNFFLLKNEQINARVFGGPNLTPQSSPLPALISGWVLQEPLIVGPIANRYRMTDIRISNGTQFNLMLCNLFIERSTFIKFYFDHELVTAEENEVLYRIAELNVEMISTPLLFVWHERRKNLKLFLKQIFYYGVGRGQVFNKASKLRQIPFLLPLIFLFLFIFSLSKWPFVMSIFVISWLLAIQIRFFNYFNKLHWSPLILPFSIFLIFSAGFLKGNWLVNKAFFFHRVKINENLF